jgi:hypothetical protein
VEKKIVITYEKYEVYLLSPLQKNPLLSLNPYRSPVYILVGFGLESLGSG